MTKPLISTIIPVFNGAAFIRAALESVAAQRHPNLEMIVIDDGSTDETEAEVRSFAEGSQMPVLYLRQENMGPAAARNRGIALANAEILAFQDADDLWTPDKLAVQLPLLEGPEPADVVMGQAQIFTEGSPATAQAAPGGFLGFQAALFRRSVFDRVGLLNETLRIGEDLDWFMRAREAGARIRLHSEAVLFYRRHANNLTPTATGNSKVTLFLLKQSLARRRQEAKSSDD